MSSATIGSVVGAGIGFFVTGGNPAGASWGWMIGGAVGALVDPQKVYGPRLTDARTQYAQDGVPRTRGYGTFPTTGIILWQDALKERKNKSSGKGGPTQVTYTYTTSYAIGVCKGPITGYLIIKRNGKIVFDARADDELVSIGYTTEQIKETRAAQSKFLQNATFYYGDDIQIPDPTIQAVKGVDNTPAYRGSAYIVVTDDDVTAESGAIPQYEFVVSQCGDLQNDTTIAGQLIVCGVATTTGAPMWATASATAVPEFIGIAQSTGADISEGIPAYSNGTWVVAGINSARYSQDAGNNWHESLISTDGKTVNDVAGTPSGWLVHVAAVNPIRAAQVDPIEFTSLSDSEYTTGNAWPAGLRSSYTAYSAFGYFFIAYNRNLWRSIGPRGPWENICNESTLEGDPNGSMLQQWISICEGPDGLLYAATVQGFNIPRYQVRTSSDMGVHWNNVDILVDRTSEQNAHPLQVVMVRYGEGIPDIVCLANDGYVWSSSNGWAAPISVGMTTSGRHHIAAANGRAYIVNGNKCVVFDPREGSMSSPITLPISGVTGIAAAPGEFGIGVIPVPDAPGYYIDPVTGIISGPDGMRIDPCKPTVGEIVASESAIRIQSSRIDVSELTELVSGYRIANQTSPQATIQGLQPGYFFDASDFDGKIHYVTRGRPSTFSISADALVDAQGQPVQWERTKENDLLRKVTVGYIDPQTTYTTTTQDWERRSSTIQARGESVVELAVTADKDWAKRVADKSIKVAWGEPDECTFSVSIDHADLVTGAWGTVQDTDGSVHTIRVTRIEDDGLSRIVTARRTRSSAYQSTAAGVTSPLPEFPGTNIRGPSVYSLLNIPALQQSDDMPGLYWACRGVMNGWEGAILQFQRNGEWVTVSTIISPSTMGSITSELPYSGSDYTDAWNVLSVSVNYTLQSVTEVQMLDGANAGAIANADGTAEIVQWRDAVSAGPGSYELSYLQRGRKDTSSSSHDAGSQFVVLDQSIRFVPIDPSDLGTDLAYRVVTSGSDPDSAEVKTIHISSFESVREWSVASLSADRETDDTVVVRWYGRPRLGTNVFPQQSVHFIGYRIEYTDGVKVVRKDIPRTPLVIVSDTVDTPEVSTHIYTASEQVADFGYLPTSITATVSAVSSISGPGQTESVSA